MLPVAPPSGGQSGRFRPCVGVGVLQIVLFFPPSFLPLPPRVCLRRKQRQTHAHPSCPLIVGPILRYWKSRDKLPGRRSVTAAPPPGRQCAVMTCWKLVEGNMCVRIIEHSLFHGLWNQLVILYFCFNQPLCQYCSSATSLDCLTFGHLPLEEVKVRSDHIRAHHGHATCVIRAPEAPLRPQQAARFIKEIKIHDLS